MGHRTDSGSVIGTGTGTVVSKEKEIEKHDFPAMKDRDFGDIFRCVVEDRVEELAEGAANVEGSLSQQMKD